MNRPLAILALLLGAAMSLRAEDEEPSPQEQARLAEALAPSIVRVEYTLQFDKGEPPRGGGWEGKCPNCGGSHGGSGLDDLVQEERPLETPGFLISPTRVVAPDPMIHPRFVKSVVVRFGDRAADVRPAAYARAQGAVFLDLAEPLPGAAPLAFAADAPPPYRAVTYQADDGIWTISARGLSGLVSVSEKGRRFSSAPAPSLIVDEKGKPVAVSVSGELPVDGSWKVSPAEWPSLDAAGMAKALEAMDAAAQQGLPRVNLRFRSPKAQPGNMYRRFHSSDEESEGATERHVVGVLLDERQILVLSNLKKGVTARLEQVIVHFPGGEPVPAKFSRTLADYGAFVATLEKPAKGAIAFSGKDLAGTCRVLLSSVNIVIQGEKRVAYFKRDILSSLRKGWKGRLYPSVPRDESQGTFFFDPEGALLAVTVQRREKVEDENSRWRSSQAEVVPVAYLKDSLTDKPENVAAGNVPLTETEENRIGWMGVELQAMNRDLARANNVSDQTRDGSSGALVSYVYPGSPAQQAGIEPGYVLLRLHVQDVPKPAEVRVEDSPFGRGNFPWDRYDELPEEGFEHVPVPWTPVDNSFNLMLTEFGFGKKYKAEFFHGGQIVLKDFEVVVSPPHYDSAPKYKSVPLGVTVRDLTFDVRRYFQMEAADPGVIVSKIEPGSKVSVAGLKPYEVITRVNDAPVSDVKEFEKQVAGATGELRLSVKRMTKTRQIKIQLGGGAAEEKGKEKGKKGPEEEE